MPGPVVRIIGGPYLAQIGRLATVLPHAPGTYLPVHLRVDGESRVLDLLPEEVDAP